MSIVDRIKAAASRNVQDGLAAAARVARNRLDALELFRPTSYQEPVVLSEASEIGVFGGTRSGKSVIVAAMMAAYLRNKPITFADGSKHQVREEAWKNRPTVLWLVGLQLNHIGQTLHRLLCRAGAFEIVRDPQTGLWRAWQPGRIPGDDLIPPDQRKPAPPFLPPSCIVKETWENKAEYKFTSLETTDGSMVYGFASSGDVKRGDPVNRIWVDEEIKFSDHYAEWMSRLSDRKGRILWTSWPDIKTPALLRLYNRAIEQEEEFARGHRTKLDVQRFRFIGSESPFIDKDEIRKRAEGWTETERRARDFGEFVVDTIQTYPEFNRQVHVVSFGESNPLNDRITEAMAKLNWNVPADWTVDLILDPGTRRPALLWGAVPPPEFWDGDQPSYVVFRELAVPRINAYEMAQRAMAADPGRRYSRFIIDRKGGDQTPMGFAWSVHTQYAKEFERVGLRCQMTGSMFMPGDHVWVTRSMKLRRWFVVSPLTGRAPLRIVSHACPELIRQLEGNVRAVSKEDVQDKPAEGQIQDVMVCLEYWAGSDPRYLPQTAPDTIGSPVMQAYLAEKEFFSGLQGRRTSSSSTIVLGIG